MAFVLVSVDAFQTPTSECKMALTVLIFDLLPICLVYARIAGSLYRANKAANAGLMISHRRGNCTGDGWYRAEESKGSKIFDR